VPNVQVARVGYRYLQSQGGYEIQGERRPLSALYVLSRFLIGLLRQLRFYSQVVQSDFF
ncbi:hypothetical protein D046_8329B, partial [Vibrio parahaemolyticus V-223/04]